MKGILCIAWQIVSFLLFRTRQMRRLKELEKTEPVAAQEEAIAEVRKMFHRCLKGCHVNVTVKGLDNIPKDRPVLYVGNHRGFFDCVVGYTTVPGRVGFVAKKELTKYPFLPDWMLLLNCLFLDRKDMKQSLRTILEAIAKVKGGVSMWIFPEGTRNRGELLDMLPFKEGSLKIAEKSKCPVVPVAITGTAELLEAHAPWVHPGDVTIRFGEPFYIAELPEENRKFPGAYTRERILTMLREEVGA